MNSLVTPGFDDVVDILRKKGITDQDEIQSWLVANNRKLWIGDQEQSPLSAILSGHGGMVAAAAMFYTRPAAFDIKVGDDPAQPPKVVQIDNYREHQKLSGPPSNDDPPPQAA